MRIIFAGDWLADKTIGASLTDQTASDRLLSYWFINAEREREIREDESKLV